MYVKRRIYDFSARSANGLDVTDHAEMIGKLATYSPTSLKLEEEENNFIPGDLFFWMVAP